MGYWRTIVVEDDYGGQAAMRDVLKMRRHHPVIFHPAEDPPLFFKHTCRCRQDTYRCADFIITARYTPCGDALNWVEHQIAEGCRIPKMAVMAENWDSREKQKAQKLACAVFDKPVDILAMDNWLADAEKTVMDEVTYAEWFLRSYNKDNATDKDN